MKFIVDRDHFLEPLSRVSTVVEKNPPLPILSQVLLQSVEGGIRLTGSNIQMEISEVIPEIQLTGSHMFAFAGRTVLGFCRRLPPRCKLEIEIEQDSMTITKLDSATTEKGDASDPAQSRFKTAIQDQLQEEMPGYEDQPRDFPILEPGEMSVGFEVSRSDLHSLIRRTRHAMGRDDTRYFLNAMLFEIGQNEFRTVATDGHRMATSLSAVPTNLDSERHHSIVPRQTVLDINKLLSEISGTVTIEFNNRHVRLRTPLFSFTSKLLEGSYPDWRGAVPANLPLVLTVNRRDLTTILRRVNGTLVPELDKRPISVSLEKKGNVLHIYAESKMGYEQIIDERLEFDEPSEHPFKVQINCRYLLDVLEAMPDCELVDIHYRDDQGACIVQFPEEKSSLFVIMLLRDR